jgi:HlyD family secretion protein
MLKKLAIGGGIILVGAIGGFLVLQQTNGATVTAQEASTRQTATVERTTLNTTIESSGTIEAARVVYLTFDSNGQVQSIAVNQGETVTQGQTLAQLDTTDLEYQIALQEQAFIQQQSNYDKMVATPTTKELAQAQSSVLSAESQVASAQNSLNNASNQVTINCANVSTRQTQYDDAQVAYRDYVKNGYEWDANFQPDPDSAEGKQLTDTQNNLAVAQAQCDNTTPASIYEAQIASAQASLAQAQASLAELQSGATQEEITSAQAQLAQSQLQLDNAKRNLENATIIAPFDGTIATINIVEGQMVNSNTQAITLLDNSQQHIDVSVDEMDVPQLAVGQKVTITPSAVDSQSYEGEITSIAPLGNSADGIVTYTVRVNLPQEVSEALRVGMTADVEFLITSATNVLAVDTDAIQREGSTEFVEVLNADGTTSRVDVTTGISANGLTEIQGDITEGVRVVIVERTTTTTTTGGAGGFPPFGGGN